MTSYLASVRSFIETRKQGDRSEFVPPSPPKTEAREGSRKEAIATPATPYEIVGVAGKSEQKQRCHTCHTCHTKKTVTREAKRDKTRTEAETVIAEWRAAIVQVKPTLHEIDKLKSVCLRFLDSPDAIAAVENGWDAVSLFGMHEGDAPKERLDAWGLVLFLAWGIHGCTVESIDQRVCALRTRSGAVQTLRCNRANFDQAVPWWLHPGITNRNRGRSMSTLHDVLKRAQAAGVEIIPDGDQLRLRASAEPPRELLDELRAHKPALIQLLTQLGGKTPGASEVLTRLINEGVTLRFVGDELKVWGPESVFKAAWRELRPHKLEVIKLLASPEHGPDMPAAERIKAWLRVVNEPPATACKCWKRLADATEAFATGCRAYDAIAAGWNVTTLFASLGGLIPEMAHRTLHLMAIDKDKATLMDGRGKLQRFRISSIIGRPWWEHPKFASASQCEPDERGQS